MSRESYAHPHGAQRLRAQPKARLASGGTAILDLNSASALSSPPSGGSGKHNF
ncbi:MAG: hypothetical protein AVDCRST_MAG89-4475 [uncultured Gemmatimonadetes bacterium]|uniref:Uncharacterized protein n=1 Tax=uncultured Gemmatimonadota bacterium TaxID=203437 RepID=A0A6J4MUU0_9BACT|nr:MAG: hypothetical protein AVDCRST_MAG89-4475 [uncultured Gemmatimonadota bacterium]